MTYSSFPSAYHREMNAPVNQAIGGLQQSLTTLQTTMLQNDLIGSQAVLRTIRASSSLENAQVAWGRFLNLPGEKPGADSGSSDVEDGSDGGVKRSNSAITTRNARLVNVEAEYARFGRPFVV
jgi:hypothetical protein